LDPKELVKHFSNRSRKAAKVGNRLLVPRTLDSEGHPLPTTELGNPKYVWNFTLKEARFLRALRESNGNFDKATAETGVDVQWAKKFLQKKSAIDFLAEDDHNAALAEIASPMWVKGKLVSVALAEEVPTDEQKWAIDRLKDIVMPKNAPSVQINNVLVMPTLSAEQLAKLKALGDELADVVDTEAKVA
jgi:hypothetical protein